jgi:hypothetical protein
VYLPFGIQCQALELFAVTFEYTGGVHRRSEAGPRRSASRGGQDWRNEGQLARLALDRVLGTRSGAPLHAQTVLDLTARRRSSGIHGMFCRTAVKPAYLIGSFDGKSCGRICCVIRDRCAHHYYL